MSLVRVKNFWVNPDAVVAIWHDHVEYSDGTNYWAAKMRCDEGQSWAWKYDTEEDAVRTCDELAAEVNAVSLEPAAPAKWPMHDDNRPHSRACGIHWHPHGTRCSVDCPTCGGKELQ